MSSKRSPKCQRWPFGVGGLVAPLAVERVLQLHRDVGALGDRVRVVRVDVVDVHVHDHGREPDLERTVDAMDVGVRVPDHHDAGADAHPAEVVAAELHPGFAVLDEPEHACEVVDRRQLVLVGEPRIDVGGRADLRLDVLVIDGRHEALLLSGEDRGVTRVVQLDAIGSQTPERIEVVAHDPILPGSPPTVLSVSPGSLPLGPSSSRSRRRARLSRERTVPTGMPSASAISS